MYTILPMQLTAKKAVFMSRMFILVTTDLDLYEYEKSEQFKVILM